MEAMDKSGFSNFKPEIEELLLNIEREETKHQSNKKKKAEEGNEEVVKEEGKNEEEKEVVKIEKDQRLQNEFNCNL